MIFSIIQYGIGKKIFFNFFKNFFMVCIKLYANCIALHFAVGVVFVLLAIGMTISLVVQFSLLPLLTLNSNVYKT
jgi:hypothetical protein